MNDKMKEQQIKEIFDLFKRIDDVQFEVNLKLSPVYLVAIIAAAGSTTGSFLSEEANETSIILFDILSKLPEEEKAKCEDFQKILDLCEVFAIEALNNINNQSKN